MAQDWLLLQLSCPLGSEGVEEVYVLVEPTPQQVSCPHSSLPPLPHALGLCSSKNVYPFHLPSILLFTLLSLVGGSSHESSEGRPGCSPPIYLMVTLLPVKNLLISQWIRAVDWMASLVPHFAVDPHHEVLHHLPAICGTCWRHMERRMPPWLMRSRSWWAAVISLQSSLTIARRRALWSFGHHPDPVGSPLGYCQEDGFPCRVHFGPSPLFFWSGPIFSFLLHLPPWVHFVPS